MLIDDHLLTDDPEIWDLFTRKEEYYPKKLDPHNRFTYELSSSNNILEPHVSSVLMKNYSEIEYPENRNFTVCLTHDIDDIYPPLKHTILSSICCIKSLNFESLERQILWKFKGKKRSPYINFQKIMELEDAFNAKSSFYVITTDKDPNRFRYNVEDVCVELGDIVDRGWEVGLHGGYYAYDDLYEIRKEKEKLEQVLGTKVIGYRNHYLRFRVPDSWELLSKAGFKYDTTFGYSDAVGFRNGMCHPFRPYNLNENKAINIIEIPLVIMDGSLFNTTNSFEDAWKYTKYLIDTVEKYHGVLTVLWHGNIFSCPFRKNWEIVYEKLLKYCSEKNAWMTSAKNVYEWWTNEY